MKKESDAKTCDEWEIKVAKSFEEVEAVRDIWEQMQRGESMPALNSNIDHYLSILQSLEEEVQPYVLVLYYNDVPKAMVIGRIEKQQITCRVGYTIIFKPKLRCLSVVYGGIFGQTSEQVCARLVQELIDTLKRGNVDVVFLNHLHIDSHVRRLSNTMIHYLCRDYFQVVQDHWQTYLPETAETFYASIKRKRKKEWKRLSRRLEDAAGGPLKLECYDSVNQVEHFIEVASKISAMTYKEALDVGFSDSSYTHSY
jgi:superfamily II DNA helicase RecQ